MEEFVLSLMCVSVLGSMEVNVVKLTMVQLVIVRLKMKHLKLVTIAIFVIPEI